MSNNISDLIQRLGDFVQSVEKSVQNSETVVTTEEPAPGTKKKVDEQGQTTTASVSATIAATIDNSTDDNGFLRAVEQVYPATSNTDTGSDGTSKEAFNNLRKLNGDIAIIVGHGAAGIISTGDGEGSGTDEQYMAADNKTIWQPYAEKGITGDSLVLFACNVAKGGAGTSFLQLVANAIGKQVGGWTGTVWADAGTNAVWAEGSFVISDPTGKISQSSEEPVSFMASPKTNSFQIKRGKSYDQISLNKVHSVHLTPVAKGPRCLLSSKHLSGEEAGNFLREINFENPRIETQAVPAARLRAQIAIQYTDGNSQTPCVRSFNLLGSSVLQDASHRSHYYDVSDKFEDYFNE